MGQSDYVRSLRFRFRVGYRRGKLVSISSFVVFLAALIFSFRPLHAPVNSTFLLPSTATKIPTYFRSNLPYRPNSSSPEDEKDQAINLKFQISSRRSRDFGFHRVVTRHRRVIGAGIKTARAPANGTTTRQEILVRRI